MVTIEKKVKVKYYWYAWFCAVVLLISVWFTLGNNLSTNQLFLLFGFYFIPTGVALMCINYYDQSQFLEYLKKNHRTKWLEVTPVPITETGGFEKAFRRLSFLFSGEDLGDKSVQLWKKRIINLQAITLTFIATSPGLFISLFICC
jgi:hypothetical protein